MTADYHHNCKLEFGDYTQMHEQHNNSMNPHTIAFWHCSQLEMYKGGLFHRLTISKVTNHLLWTQLTMPNEVIDLIHWMAHQEHASHSLLFEDQDHNEFVDPDNDDDKSYHPDGNDDDGGGGYNSDEAPNHNPKGAPLDKGDEHWNKEQDNNFGVVPIDNVDDEQEVGVDDSEQDQPEICVNEDGSEENAEGADQESTGHGNTDAREICDIVQSVTSCTHQPGKQTMI